MSDLAIIRPKPLTVGDLRLAMADLPNTTPVEVWYDSNFTHNPLAQVWVADGKLNVSES